MHFSLGSCKRYGQIWSNLTTLLFLTRAHRLFCFVDDCTFSTNVNKDPVINMSAFYTRLVALGYPNPNVNEKGNALSLLLSPTLRTLIVDEQDFRHLIVWLEDIKIKHFKELSKGENLRRTRDENWNTHYSSYLTSIGCPSALAQDDMQSLCWLLGEALMADDDKSNLDIKGELPKKS